MLWKSPLDITLLNTVTARWINVKGHRSWIHCDISCPPDAAFQVNIVQPSGVRTTNSTSRLVEPDRGLAHYEGSRWFWGHHLSRNWPARFLSCFEHPQRVRIYIDSAETTLPKYLSVTPAGCPLGLSLKVSLWVFSRPPKYKRSPSRPTMVTKSFTNEESTYIVRVIKWREMILMLHFFPAKQVELSSSVESSPKNFEKVESAGSVLIS